MIISFTKEVIHGKGKGHLYGMPTANQKYDGEEIPYGVYGGKAYVDDQCYLCITNVGLRPSDDDNKTITVESMLLDFEGDLYGKLMRVDLYFYLRGIMKFPGGLKDVRAQLEKDAEKTRELFKSIV